MLVATIGRALAQKSRGLARLEPDDFISKPCFRSTHEPPPEDSAKSPLPQRGPQRRRLCEFPGRGRALFGGCTQNVAVPLADPRARSSTSLHRHMLITFETIHKAFARRNVWFVSANGHTVSNALDLSPPQRLTGTGSRLELPCWGPPRKSSRCC